MKLKSNAFKYKAFISYSHKADEELANVIQSSLHKFAKPWNKIRALNIYRDKTNLAASPQLWPEIEKALSESEYFLLFASVRASQSKWVTKEISWWVKNRTVEKMIILLTNGEIVWSDDCNDFDWNITTALPKVLINKLSTEPKLVDFRWTKNEQVLNLRNPIFLENFLDIASPLHGIEKNLLGGEDVRQLKLTKLLAWSASAAIIAGIFISIWQTIVAKTERNEAINQSEIALSRQLAAESELLRTQDFKSLPLSVLLGVEAIKRYPGPQIDQIIWSGIELLPRLRYRINHARVSQIKPSSDGRYIATAGQDSTARVALAENDEEILRINHLGSVWDVAFDPDNSVVATASDDGLVKVVDLTTKKINYVLAHNFSVRKVLFSPNGKYLASASSDSTSCIWESQTGKKIATIKHRGLVWALEFSHDGKYLATGARDSTVHLWNLETMGEERVLNHNGMVWSVKFSVDDQYLAVGSEEKYATVWAIRTFRKLQFLNHDDRIIALAFSPDGKYLGTSSWDRKIKIWSVEGFNQMANFNSEGVVLSIAFSPDSKYLAAGSKSTRVWSMESFEELNRIYEGKDTYNLIFSPDSKYLFTADSDVARSWEILDSKRKRVETMDRISDRGVPILTAGWCVRLGQKENTLLTGSENGVATLWNMETKEALMTFNHGNPITTVSYSEQSLQVATAGGGFIKIWNAKNGREVSTILNSGTIESMTFDKLGTQIAFGDSNQLKIALVQNGKVESIADLERDIYLVFYNNTGDNLITYTSDGNFTHWDFKKRVILEKMNTAGGFETSLSNNLESIAYSVDSLIRITDINKNKESTHVIAPGIVSLIAIGDPYVAFCLKGDSTMVNLWKFDRLTNRTKLNHGRKVTAISIDESRKYIATGCDDGSIHIWEISSGREISTIRWNPEDRITKLNFSFDSKYIVVASEQFKTSAWLWKPADAIKVACSCLDLGLTEIEWQRYFGEREFHPTCPDVESN